MPYPTGSGFHTRLCRDLWRCHKVGVGALDDPPPPQTPVHLRPRFRRARAARLCRSTSLRFAQNDTDGWALHTAPRRRGRQRGVEGAAPYGMGALPHPHTTQGFLSFRRLYRKTVGRGLAPAVYQRKTDCLPAKLANRPNACAPSSEIPPRVRGAASPFDFATLRSE